MQSYDCISRFFINQIQKISPYDNWYKGILWYYRLSSVNIAFVMLAVIISGHRVRHDPKCRFDFVDVFIFDMWTHIDDCLILWGTIHSASRIIVERFIARLDTFFNTLIYFSVSCFCSFVWESFSPTYILVSVICSFSLAAGGVVLPDRSSRSDGAMISAHCFWYSSNSWYNKAP